MDKITEIRLEEIFDEENNQHYYWIYYFKNGEVKIIGKSSVKPQCYRHCLLYTSPSPRDQRGSRLACCA